MKKAFNFDFNGLMPTARILEWRHRFLRLELEGATESFVRVLRRIMRTEVPTIAIDLVLIQTNSSQLSDSFLTRRLTHMPLTSGLANLLYYSTDCPNCNGVGYCRRCSVEFHLCAKCITGETLDVTSKDVITSSPAVFPLDFGEGSAIVTLRQGEEVKLKAIARKGIGKDKIKWSPLSLSCPTYFSSAEVRINEELMETLTLQQKIEWVASCPTNMFQLVPQTQKVVLSHSAVYPYDEEVTRKAKAMGKPGLVEMREKKDTFVFTVETTGAFEAFPLLMSSIEILKQKLLSLHILEDHYDLAGLASDIQKLDSEE